MIDPAKALRTLVRGSVVAVILISVAIQYQKWILLGIGMIFLIVNIVLALMTANKLDEIKRKKETKEEKENDKSRQNKQTTKKKDIRRKNRK